MPNAARFLRMVRVLSAVVVAALCLHGCSPAEEDQSQWIEVTGQSDNHRFVTLAPALTQILKDLKLDDMIVGVAENDSVLGRQLPVVGTYVKPNAEQLLTVKPTHVFMMVGKEGVPQALADLAEANGFVIVSYPYPQSTADVANIIMDYGDTITPDETTSLGVLLGIEAHAGLVARELRERLAGIEEIVTRQDRARPSTLLLLGTRPVMASGPGTVHSELLFRAGGVNAASEEFSEENSLATAPTFSKEGLASMKPEVVILLQPGAEPFTGPDDPRLAEFRGLEPIPAIENNRVHVMNQPTVMLPSSSLPSICAAMAKLLHPDLADEIDAYMQQELADEVLSEEEIEAARKALEAELRRGDDTGADDDTADEPTEPGSVE